MFGGGFVFITISAFLKCLSIKKALKELRAF
jgi:hypothetical protein